MYTAKDKHCGKKLEKETREKSSSALGLEDFILRRTNNKRKKR